MLGFYVAERIALNAERRSNFDPRYPMPKQMLRRHIGLGRLFTSSWVCSTRLAVCLSYVRAYDEISGLMARDRARDPIDLETRSPSASPSFVAAARPRRNAHC